MNKKIQLLGKDQFEHHDSDHAGTHGMHLGNRRTFSIAHPSFSVPPSMPTAVPVALPDPIARTCNSPVPLVTRLEALSRAEDSVSMNRRRRFSHDPIRNQTARLFMVNVAATKALLLAQEDTDADSKITVLDKGPRVFSIPMANSFGVNSFEIRGTYPLSNLLQELQLASDHGRNIIILSEDRLLENPLERLHRLIKFNFWDALTRRLDARGLEALLQDSKSQQKNTRNRIYVPYHDTVGLEYFERVKVARLHFELDIVRLPEIITPMYVKGINAYPGILALGLRKIDEGKGWDDLENVCGTPFVVPGGRFNEQYGWDSYFEALGLIVDGRIDLAQGMLENFVYEIEHYGKILNANRSYYLTRAQPPFLTDMLRQIYANFSTQQSNNDPPTLPAKTIPQDSELETGSSGVNTPMSLLLPDCITPQAPLRKVWEKDKLRAWLARCTRACVKELLSVWLGFPRLDVTIGLSKYVPDGIGIPPETESGHFHAYLKPYAAKLGVSVDEFEKMYNNGDIQEPELDAYFIHDCAARESGHDTTYRFDATCANLTTVDLNSLVYKYETDLSELIADEFGGSFWFRVRCGPDGCYLRDFHAWLTALKTHDLDKLLGGGQIWNSTWAKGVMVFDEAVDVSLSCKDDTAVFLPTPIDRAHPHLPTFAQASSESPWFTVNLPSILFTQLASRTRNLIHTYLWNESRGLFFDYDCSSRQQTSYETATNFWPLWARVATQMQADQVVKNALPLFEVVGGLVSTTEASRGGLGEDRPSRQWDYPFGWAPHQMLAWKGLENYDRRSEACRLIYRWLYMCVKAFVEYNGVVPEKFDVVNMTHLVTAEYGNVGVDFKYIVREGFGWMNASVQVGLQYMDVHMRRSLGRLIHPDVVFGTMVNEKLRQG
ncbi:alpha,alpha-trehalase [Chytriomyces confervae]|uniref:alpha,alpha-trehalase n=1 Tax=Chytriomyces confervae TaxID=246404 RepID=A0A507FAJ5_9FUNG|nr:alpha,alpha-trehalase [Chytriomyces confervae]